MNNNINHGGDLDLIEKNYNIPKNEIIDFSGNINPLGFPENLKNELSKNIDIISIYPDKTYTKLKKSISIYTNSNIENIIVGNGSTELISTFVKTIQPKKTIIIAPVYSEYEKEVSICKSEIKYFELKEKNNFEIDLDKLLFEITNKIDMIIICNPNNPTGAIMTSKQIEILATHCKKTNTFIMIDETYIEFSENIEKISSTFITNKFDNIFVIRGIAKFFSAPGIRLGYAICSNKKFLNNFNSLQNPWSVNIFASFIGERIFEETDFIEKSKSLISEERKKALLKLSEFKNIKAYNSQSNFILLKLLTNKINSSKIFEILIKQKMLIRNAENFKFLDNNYIRFCLLKPEQNKKLLYELENIIE